MADATDPMHAPDFLSAADPFALLKAWEEDARRSEARDWNAAQVATVDSSALPDIRTVLVKSQGEKGFVLLYEHPKREGQELTANAKAALLYYWKTLSRQIRARGEVRPVSDAEADAYFATRPRESQLGAWASLQSEVMASRAEFEKRYAQFRDRFANSDVPRPPHWSGFCLVPSYIEFWQERPFRLHDRLAFERSQDGWRRFQLYP